MKQHSIDCLEKLLYKSDDIQVVQIAKMDCYSELLKFIKSKRFIKTSYNEDIIYCRLHVFETFIITSEVE